MQSFWSWKNALKETYKWTQENFPKVFDTFLWLFGCYGNIVNKQRQHQANKKVTGSEKRLNVWDTRKPNCPQVLTWQLCNVTWVGSEHNQCGSGGSTSPHFTFQIPGKRTLLNVDHRKLRYLKPLLFSFTEINNWTHFSRWVRVIHSLSFNANKKQKKHNK